MKMDFNLIKLISMSTKKILFLVAFTVCGLLAADGFAQNVEEAVEKTAKDAAKTAIEEVESEVNTKLEKRRAKKDKKRKKLEAKPEKEVIEAQKKATKPDPEEQEQPQTQVQESQPDQPKEKSSSEVPANGDRTQAYLEEFKKLDVSYIGSTQNCVGYNVYAIKYKRTWFLATNVNESPVLSVFVEKPPRTEDAFPVASPFLVEGLKGILVNQYAKKKNRRKKVKDLQLYGFYKLKRPGRQAAKGLLLIEYPKELNKEPDFFLFKMFYDMFNKKKEEMKPDPNIQKQFEDKLKAPLDKAKEELSTVSK